MRDDEKQALELATTTTLSFNEALKMLRDRAIIFALAFGTRTNTSTTIDLTQASEFNMKPVKKKAQWKQELRSSKSKRK